MPTYEYKCDDCGYRFEKFQRMTDARLTECPECQGAVRRLIGAGAGIIFKGSGFYCTDYRKSSEPAKAPEASSSSKPAATPAAKS
ncbi:MAG: zinc ribbon domain-containing protein [Lentisphaeria bacterium]|nr:zinc ribbon domain-containing protein [Lentisphaeria bacterium]